MLKIKCAVSYFSEGADRSDASSIEVSNLMTVSDRGKAVLNTNEGHVTFKFNKGLRHGFFCLRIERTGGLIQHDQFGSGVQRFRKPETLPLPTTQTHAVLPDKGVQPVALPGEKSGELGPFECLPDAICEH